MGAGHGQGQNDGARADDHDAEVEQVAAEPSHEREPCAHPGEHPDDHRHQRQPGVDRGEALTELGEQRDAEQQAAERAEEREPDQEPARVGAVGQQSRLDQRIAIETALPQHERDDQDRSGGERRRRSRRGHPAARPWISG